MIQYSFITLLLLSTAISASVVGQTPWDWAKIVVGQGSLSYDEQVNGTIEDGGAGICTDAGGNEYVAGTFSDSVITFGNSILVNPHYNSLDAFTNAVIAKFDASGNAVWASNITGSGHSSSQLISIDAGGNLYLAGYFYGDTINVGNITLTVNYTPFDSSAFYPQGIFIAKFDASGNVLWAKAISASTADAISAIAPDNDGNIIVTGSIKDSVLYFGSTTVYNPDYVFISRNGLIGNVPGVPFIVKYDAAGNALWATNLQIDGVPNSMRIDKAGNIYLSGIINSNVFKIGPFGTNAAEVYFIAKCDSMGNMLRSQSDTGTIYQLGLDSQGNLFESGFFGLDSGSTHGSGVYGIIALIKSDSSGKKLWSKDIYPTSTYELVPFVPFTCVDIDAADNVYLAGNFADSVLGFDNQELVNPNQSQNIFVAKYSSAGNIQWVQSTPPFDTDNLATAFIGGMAIDADQHVSITGGVEDYNLFTGKTEDGEAPNKYFFIARLADAEGINNTTGASNVLVYPNPTTGKCYLSGAQNSRLDVYDLLGQCLYSSFVAENSFPLDLSKWPGGTYIYQLTGPSSTRHSGKIVLAP